jgi:Ca2+-binding RTX toxin-like protein
LIAATTWFGVDFSSMGVADFGWLENTGTIRGVQGAFNGNDTADVVINRGAMVGQILLGAGADVYDGRSGRTEGLVQGGDGTDLIDVRGAAMVSGDLFGGIGADTIRGSDGDEYLSGDDDSDVLHGHGGDDTLLGDLGDDQLRGGAGNDALYAGASTDVLSGGDGDDVLDGGDGNSNAFGGSGDDALVISTGVTARFILAAGGAGDDTVDGGGGDDNVFGGAGNDDIRTLLGNDTVGGGDGADRVVLSDGADSGSGGQGDDTLLGDVGADRLFGDAGNDVLFGGTGADVLNGGLGDDNVNGGDGADAISGGAGHDTINGGLQRDALTGGAGDDVFVFLSRSHTGLTLATADRISDVRAGTDLIDLSALDARANVVGNQAFNFVGTASLTGASGRLRYDVATGLVQGDVTGDGVADFAILIQNRAALTALDFVL